MLATSRSAYGPDDRISISIVAALDVELSNEPQTIS
jgi:hypothetical protein